MFIKTESSKDGTGCPRNLIIKVTAYRCSKTNDKNIQIMKNNIKNEKVQKSRETDTKHRPINS